MVDTPGVVAPQPAPAKVRAKPVRKPGAIFRVLVRIEDKSKRNRFTVSCEKEKVTLREPKQVTDEIAFLFEQYLKQTDSGK